jgi:predicted SprT family Zn-dependent metalloprotease
LGAVTDWQPILNELHAALLRWASLWGLPRLTQQATLEFSPRMTTTLGRCNCRTGRIKINPLLLLPENRELLFETVCHELAHLAATAHYGRSIQPHGTEWKGLMQRAGYPGHATVRAHRIHGLPARKTRTARYEVHCPACQMTWRKHRRDLRWRCRRCLEAGREGRLVFQSLAPA